MKELYEAPKMEVVVFDAEDIIVASGNGNETDPLGLGLEM